METKEALIDAPAIATEFFPSGSTLLDLVLGGGWALRRVFNLVGDSGSGKTLLAVEAFINFMRTFNKCRMRYVEPEARFNQALADQIGFPPEVERPEDPLDTIEDFQLDFSKFMDKDPDIHKLYILDSLDSLSDQKELERFGTLKKKGDEEAGSYGTEKAKKMSAMFRMLSRSIEKSNCTLGIISQLRDNIGVTYGEHSTRSGGRALTFYSSQIIWLREVAKLKRTAFGEERSVGVQVACKNKKNSCGMPFRDAQFDLIFGYGTDDALSMLKWLKSTEGYNKEVFDETHKQVLAARNKQDYDKLDEIESVLRQDTRLHWKRIDDRLRPVVRKYR